MDAQVMHQSLLNAYRSYLTILHDRGVSYETPDEKEIEKMSDVDLAAMVRSLRDIARTPGAR